MQKLPVSLYPGFLTKAQGKVFWHSNMPIFDSKSNQWSSVNIIDVTSCIHDPWPHTAGGKDSIAEIVQK